MLEPYVFSHREQVPTLEAVAGAHLQAMRAVQPQGPYRLGGFCKGGLLAYEMARHALRHVYRRLRPRGRRVQDFEKLLVIEPRLAAMFPPREALYRDYVGVFDWLAGRYRTGRYGGRITFYWAREEPAIARSWQPLIMRNAPAGHREHTIEGALMSSVTDHVQGLARKLSDDLDRAGQRTALAKAAVR